MAILRDCRNGRSWWLESECVIGRSPACSVRLDDNHVSSQHARVRWTGKEWELRDLGSHNGTMVDDVALVAGQSHPLRLGNRAAFGSADAHWEVVDDAPPATMVLALEGSQASVVDGGILGIPSGDDPVATIYLGSDGRWRLEGTDAPVVVLVDGQTFEVSGRLWRFSCPQVISPTETSEEEPRARVTQAGLQLRVSRDEEHVEMVVDLGARSMDMGSRSHNYLLLTLARHLEQDRLRGLPDSARGWVYVDELLKELAISASQLNIDIFRIRRQFATLGVADASEIVQRRPRTRQLRIGVARVVVTRI